VNRDNHLLTLARVVCIYISDPGRRKTDMTAKEKKRVIQKNMLLLALILSLGVTIGVATRKLSTHDDV